MKKASIFLILFSILAYISFEIYLQNQTKSSDSSFKVEKEIESRSLEELHKVFLGIDINSEKLDLDRAIQAIKQAREQYPLDDKLKMVEIELTHKKANESSKE